MQKIKLKIEGMTCMGCVRSVKKVIEKHGGKEINVSLEGKFAEFEIENKEVMVKIKEEIEILGYKAGYTEN